MKSTDEVYGSLADDGAPLLRVSLCVSKTFLVYICCNLIFVLFLFQSITICLYFCIVCDIFVLRVNSNIRDVI